jgi:hypothetical protein
LQALAAYGFAAGIGRFAQCPRRRIRTTIAWRSHRQKYPEFSGEFYGFHRVAARRCLLRKAVHKAQLESGNQAMTKVQAAILQVMVSLAAFGTSAARADLQNENLLVTAPPGYKVGFSDKNPTC